MPNQTESRDKKKRTFESKEKHTLKCFGPVGNLEEYVKKDWWKRIFNAYYLKTDGDVVEDHSITEFEVNYFSNILNFQPEHQILDLCCGQGRHSIELANKGFKNIYGLDRSRYLIQKAKSNSKKSGLLCKFQEGDARKLPYNPDTFDFILILGNSFGYFESINDDIQVLREAFRVLKPGGKILIDITDGEYVRNNFQTRSWEWIDKNLFVCRERSLSLDEQKLISREVINHVNKGVLVDQFYAERLYSQDGISELLKKVGFNDVIVHGSITPDSQRDQDLGMMEKRIIVSGIVEKEWTPIKTKEKIIQRNIVVIFGDPKKPDILKPLHKFDNDDFFTINQLKAVLKEFDEYKISYLDNHTTIIQDLQNLKGKIDFVFNLCDEGYYNEARKELHIPALLEILKIPYTGSGPQCLAFCYDKSLVRGIAKELEIPVPEAIFIKPGEKIIDLPLYFPAIVKPNFGDSSFGITQKSVVEDGEELLSAIADIREKFGYDKPILVEQFLPDKDLTVGIIGNLPDNYIILPIIEEDYSSLPPGLPKICGYEAKWLKDSPYWNIKSIPAALPQNTIEIIESCSLKLFERLECQDYARFDWRLDAKGNPKLLEVNPNPGWCWDGHLAKMCNFANITYKEMLNKILEAATRRIGST
ncbi:MAG TPA: methyltransferase domain-containing protein [Candidatus Nanopelagicaceae bacterium]|nr:methyltransferase domain-containing protein [Candidatus Nanopelagicaceae bacterium]